MKVSMIVPACLVPLGKIHFAQSYRIAAGRFTAGLVTRSGIIAVLLGSSVALSGCASIRGSQERINSADLAAFQPVCPSELQLTANHPNETSGAYRDRIIMTCVKAINAKYGKFIDSLSTESGGANLATDIIAQTLSTAASVIKDGSVSRSFAAGAAYSLGLGSTVNKDLFYKQALPAILASMDAKRSKVVTAIVEAQNRDPDAKKYTLARAGYDLDLLQQAGSLTAAVQELTSTAVQNRTAADAALKYAEIDVDVGTFHTFAPTIKDRVDASVVVVDALVRDNKETELRAIAASLGLAPKPEYNSAVLGALIRIEITSVAHVETAEQSHAMDRIDSLLAPYKEMIQ